MLKKLILISIVLFQCGHVNAKEFLNSEEIKATFSNKTFDFKHLKNGKKRTWYTGTNGEWIVFKHETGKTQKRKGKWWAGENEFCYKHPRNGDTCNKIFKIEDGKYGVVIHTGKHIHTYSNFREGNQL